MKFMSNSIRQRLESLLSLLPDNDPTRQERVELIKAAMLEHLQSSKDAPVVRVIYATSNIETLWYARGGVMQALTAIHGEDEAHCRMRVVTRMFDGLLPKEMKARRSSLDC